MARHKHGRSLLGNSVRDTSFYSAPPARMKLQ
uniref:Uncharacterized protein n=1 Tax=Moniliophthora roreri TaxID=221103 RepID=A0A0W0G366_MONRR